MRRRMTLAGTLVLLLLASAPAGAVGFQWGSAPDPEGQPLSLAIWYPSDATPSVVTAGLYRLNVALDGAVSGRGLPLVVLSHGTGGSALTHHDTALALAEAGFVVVAVTHTGDNFRDKTDSFTRRGFASRPRHVGQVIDFMLGAWPMRGAIDPRRIGLFGHSAGGATALIVAGGIADIGLGVAFCREHPDDWGCANARRGGSLPEPGSPGAAPIAAPDPRVGAVVLAAPAMAVAFTSPGLAGVGAPIQLWVAADDRIVQGGDLLRGRLPGAPDYHLVERAGHFAFLPLCGEGLAAVAAEICADPPGFDRGDFLQAFQRSLIAFYRTHLP